MTLQEVKNQLAKEQGFYSWDLCIANRDIGIICKVMNLSAQRYATECVKASLERAAENAEAYVSCSDPDAPSAEISKSSITDPENIILL